MKFAYVSVVIPTPTVPMLHDLRAIDDALRSVARAHELIVVTPFNRTATWGTVPDLTCPMIVVTVGPISSPDSATVAGLARAAGDFVIEWRGRLEDFTEIVINQLLEPTNLGYEIVEATPPANFDYAARFYRLANVFRPRNQQVRRSTARVYSRNALSSLLDSAPAEPILAILVAELPVKRETFAISCQVAASVIPRRRLSEGLSLLLKGTKLGLVVPLSLAALFGVFGITVALYAVLIYVTQSRPPEGWTTLMVVAGLGQASILLMVSLIWARIDAIVRGLTRKHDATASVETFGIGDSQRQSGHP
jgi:hypothetical protein